MAKSKKYDEVAQLAKALAHPLRLQILSILQRDIASPNEIATTLGEPLGNVSYHTKILLEFDCIELVKTEPRRGAVEHYYRSKPHAALGSRQWQKVPKDLRGSITEVVLSDFIACAIEAIEQETFHERAGSSLSAVPVTLDETGWIEVVDLLEQAESNVGKVVQKSVERLEDPGLGIPVLVSLAAFEIPSKANDRPKSPPR